MTGLATGTGATQLKPELRASIMTNPAIRFAGGVSRKDACAHRAIATNCSD